MRKLYNAIERAAHSRATTLRTRVPDAEAPLYKDYIKTRGEDDDGSKLMSRLQTIDSNIASLLTHVSAMIAATGLLLIVFEDGGWTPLFVLLEMLGYCLITIFLIVNLPFSGAIPRLDKTTMASTGIEYDSTLEVRYNVYLARRYVYVHTAYAVMILTIGFALTVLVHIAFLLPTLL